jgi:serine/threonine protein kinase
MREPVPISSERYTRAKELFLLTCEQPRHQREAFLGEACRGDDGLRREVLSLLACLDPDGRHEDSPTGVAVDESTPRVAVDENASGAAVDERPTGLSGEPLPSFPEILGDYLVLRPLGRGSMGIVYLAEHTGTRQRVALKVLRTGLLSPHLRQRFLLEAALLRRLEHPGIASLFEVGSFETRLGTLPYFAMEAIEGRRLSEFAASPTDRGGEGLPARASTSPDAATRQDARATTQPVSRTTLEPPPRATDRGRFQLMAAICEAVHHAHEQGVVHRDLKPENILVDADGQPKVLDFGVARLLDVDPRATTLMTGTGQLIGTMQYMSPEQAGAIAEPVDRRSDVYALGIIAYELLAGRRPYDVPGASLPQAIIAILQADPPPLGTIRPALHGGAEAIVEKAIRLRPADRYATAGEMAADFRRLIANERLSVSRSAPMRRVMDRFRRTLRRRPRLRRAILGALLGLPLLTAGIIVALGGTSTLGGRKAIKAASSPAEIEAAYVYILDRIDDASREIQQGSGTRPALESAIRTLKEARKMAARLPTPSINNALIRFTDWRLGEANYFIGKSYDDPVALQEAQSFWSEAQFYDTEPLALAGIDSTRSHYADIARVGMHHPKSGIASALEALAFYSTPARNLKLALDRRIEADEILRRLGIRNYLPSPTSERNLGEDRGLVLNDLAGATCRFGALTDSLPLITESLRLYARADSARDFRVHPSSSTSFLTGFGHAWLEHAERTGSRAEVDSALARYQQAIAMNDAGSAPVSYAGIKRSMGRALRLAATLAPDTARSREDLERALEEIHYATAALDSKTSLVPLAQIWREEALILGDLGLLVMSERPIARADSLLEAAAAAFPSGKYPAQASVVCYEKGRLARIHWQIATPEVDPSRGAADGRAADGQAIGDQAAGSQATDDKAIEEPAVYRLRALREFRDAAEIMPEAQNPGLHRRIREEQVLLGATGPL